MKYLMLLLFLSSACSSSTFYPHKVTKRVYRYCSPKEVKEYVGKICYRYCKKKRILGSCKEYGLVVENHSLKEIHDKMLAAEFKIRL